MLRKIFILLFVLMLVGSCKKESPFAALSGTVYYDGIAIPIQDVKIKVDHNITYSSSDGSYNIPEIIKGVYVLRAEKEGFDPYYFEMPFLKDTLFQNIQMVSEIFTSSIFGNITGDYSGEPRIGLRCVLMNPNGTESRLEAFTDSSGFYRISGVPDGYHYFKIFDDKELIYQNWIEVDGEDILNGIVFSDVIKFKDERDGTEYSALRIGDLRWMIENLAYLPYVDDPVYISNDDKRYYVYGFEGSDPVEAKTTQQYESYGALYNWKAAVSICPEGWRLPTDEDWKKLELFFGMDKFDSEMESWRNSGDLGFALKDTVGWFSGESDNRSWFNVRPGGFIGYNGGSLDEGFTASFWTSTKCDGKFAYSRSLSATENGIFRLCNSSRLGFSVRCVR